MSYGEILSPQLLRADLTEARSILQNFEHRISQIVNVVNFKLLIKVLLVSLGNIFSNDINSSSNNSQVTSIVVRQLA